MPAVHTMTFIPPAVSEEGDDADRVRRFLRDAYSRWGTAWALLGGDPTKVPTRIAWSTYGGDGDAADIVTDDYLPLPGGSWNADGDTHFAKAWSRARATIATCCPSSTSGALP
jgi:hypothetical protein